MNKSLILILSAILVMSACNLLPAEKIPAATSEKNDTDVVTIEPVKDTAISNVTPLLDTTLVNEATGAIMDLPETKRLAEYISKQSDGKNKMVVWCFSTGVQGTRKYALVHVGEDNGLSLHSHHIFYYYPNNKSILYIDTLTDSTLTLTEWRKTKVSW